MKIKSLYVLMMLCQGFRGFTQTPQVDCIYPTSDTLPQNTLRLYIYFSQPMRQDEAVAFVHLIDDRGREVYDPFLDMSHELWDPSNSRLTLLFNPARVKTGLVAHDQLGSALVSGHHYTIRIDSTWRTESGKPLQRSFVRKIYVTDPALQRLDVSTWSVDAPSSRSESPLIINFTKALDHASVVQCIDVLNSEGTRVAGNVDFLAQESRLVFTPTNKWRRGVYILQISKMLEDVCGNNLYESFEHTSHTSSSDHGNSYTTLSFQIK